MVKPDFTKIWAGSRVSIPAISSPDYVKGFAAYLGPLPPQTDDHDYIMNLQDLRALWLEKELVAKTAAATDTTAGIVQLAVAANYPASSDNDAVTPNYVAAAVASVTVPAASETVAGIIEIATNAEAQAFTADKAIDGAKLNTAFKGANQLLSSGSLFQKIPGGLILQSVSFTYISGEATVVFPVSFPNAVVGGFASVGNGPNTDISTLSGLTNSGVTIYKRTPSATAGADFTGSIFVIGY